MASISEVKLANDLRSGKVFVQVIGTPEERASTVKGMQNAHGFIRKQLRDRLSLRVAPDLIFVADEAAERADKVLGLLAGLAKERDAAAAATAVPLTVDSEADEEEDATGDE
jgi:ribosome-binding factor A